MKQQYIHASSYVRTWSCYNPNDLQQQCQLKVVYDNLKKKPMVMDMADTFREDFGIHFNQWSSNIRAGFNHILRNGSH